jgi:hypothetical protein
VLSFVLELITIDKSCKREGMKKNIFAVQYDERIGDKTIRQLDEEAGVLQNGVYQKNPTAQLLKELINPDGKIKNKNMNGTFMYVVNLNGDIIIGTRAGNHQPHPTLIGGENVLVKGAGIIDIRGGKIYKIDNASGHFRPSKSSLNNAKQAFNSLESRVFHKNFQDYEDFTGKPYPYQY